jgi:hypothetical protein
MVPSPTQIITSSWFLQDDEGKLGSQFVQEGVQANDDAKTGTHAFTILARILADPRLKMEKQDVFLIMVLEKAGDAIREYVDQWDLSGDVDLDKKLEELLWTNVLIYGVGGLEKNGDFNADFFQ